MSDPEDLTPEGWEALKQASLEFKAQMEALQRQRELETSTSDETSFSG